MGIDWLVELAAVSPLDLGPANLVGETSTVTVTAEMESVITSFVGAADDHLVSSINGIDLRARDLRRLQGLYSFL